MTFADLIPKVLEREGGYVKNASDRGGATNYGITQNIYSGWLRANNQPDLDVRSIAKAQVNQIYLEQFWYPSNCESLPESIRDIHFDSAVNHSVTRAVKLLQTACAVTVDGVIGQNTIKAANALNPELLKARYTIARYKFYGEIIQRDRSQLVFIAGWMARMAEFS